MKVSLKWLSKLVDIDGLSPRELAERLTFAGIEVESIDEPPRITGLVVGEVLTCVMAPDSDHLRLCTVDCGPRYGARSIVCGAPNVRKGLKVIVALPGAALAKGVLKAGVIHGHASDGMICSLPELGVDPRTLRKDQVEGIEELPPGAAVGDEDVLALLGLDDVTLNVKLLPNRSDLASLVNFAKEIGTLFGRKPHLPEPERITGGDEGFKVGSLTRSCPQFSALIVHGVKVGESPRPLKDFLAASGLRSVNNVVDVGNAVMLLTGEPLHVYDLKKLPKKELIVRDDLAGDMLALDEKTYKIEKGDITITSDARIMCLGGVMGTLRAAVDGDSSDLVVESARFSPARIRRTSLRLNLVSESSSRFARGVNPAQYGFVLALAKELLVKFAGAKGSSGIITYLEKPWEPTLIKSSVSRINARLGTNFAKEEIRKALEDDYIKVDFKDDDDFVATIPPARIDILESADLSEEVIRIIGFDRIVGKISDMPLSMGIIDENKRLKTIVAKYLRGIGLDEQLTYTLVDEKSLTGFHFLWQDEPYKVLHPLTDERTYVRTGLLPSLMSALRYNLNRGNEDLAFFEVSDLFSKAGRRISLAAVLAGNDRRKDRLAGEPYGYYHAKGIVEGVLDLLRIKPERQHLKRIDVRELHPGRSASLSVDGKLIAVFGELHPAMKAALGLEKTNVVVLEMDLGTLFTIGTGRTKAGEVPRFPSVRRDLAFIVDKSHSAGEIMQTMRRKGRGLVMNVEVFDVYAGEGIEPGQESLAFTVTYGSPERTLKDAEVNAVEQDIVAAVESQFGAVLRK